MRLHTLPAVADFLKLQTPQELAAFLGVSYAQHLVYNLYKVPDDRRYKTFAIQRKNGGTRNVQAPRNSPKLMQKKVSVMLQQIYEPSYAIHGYLNDRSIVTNARSDRRARHILNIDLLDFFGSINYGRVQGVFKAKPFQFSEPLATVLAQLCCYKNGLPLGTPTSPVIANIICYRLDRQMRHFARSHHCTYTRYADDITISTRKVQFPDAVAMLDSQLSVHLGPKLLAIIQENGFAPNPNKSRLLGKNARQEVTGLVVNDIPNIRRSDVRRIRAMLHAWDKYGHTLAQQEYYRKHATKSRLPDKELPTLEDVLRGKLVFLSP